MFFGAFFLINVFFFIFIFKKGEKDMYQPYMETLSEVKRLTLLVAGKDAIISELEATIDQIEEENRELKDIVCRKTERIVTLEAVMDFLREE